MNEYINLQGAVKSVSVNEKGAKVVIFVELDQVPDGLASQVGKPCEVQIYTKLKADK